jgi:iron complex transport system ATP-binding protein
MATLSIHGAVVRFDSTPALDGVHLDVANGEWLALIGPNGAGKTTLLRAIGAALPLSEGTVTLDDADVAGMAPRARARQIAVVPQEQVIPPGWSVREVVSQGRAPHLGAWRSEGADDREAVDSALRATETATLSERLISGLSGGERQRVLLARALAQTPHVLLLDEPTAFLDLQYQWEMLELVDRARKERGLTVVSVLHDLNLSAAFACRIALLKGGRIIALGTPEDVLTEETIRRGYNRRVSVGRHPATGRPTVISWPSERKSERRLRVHVISGGGSGAAIIRRLVADGHTVTAGVLNIGDTDWEATRTLSVETADEAPFSGISPMAFQRGDALVRKAEIVIVAPVPFGPGNVVNIQLATEAARRGARVLLIGRFDDERDFTKGEARTMWAEALAAGAIQVANAVEALAHLAEPVR